MFCLSSKLYKMDSFVDSILLSEAEDLKWDLHSALGNLDPVHERPQQPINLVSMYINCMTDMIICNSVFNISIHCQVVPANSFRAAVIGFSAFATRRKALYISLDSTSLGIPLALSRVFRQKVRILRISTFA